MKILKYFTLLAAAAGIMSACTSDLEKVQTLPADQVVAPVLHELENTDIVITAETLVNTLKVSWDAAYFGDKIVPNYSILIAKGDVEVPVAVGISTTEVELTYEQINLAAASSVEDGGLGLALDVASDVKLRIGATVGNSFDTYYSDAVDVKITPTSAEKKYPMIYMPGSYQGWAPDKAATNFQVLYDFSGTGVYEGVADFGSADDASREWKFTRDANWDFDWGIPSGETPEAEAAEVTLINNDGGDRSNINIYTVNRFYHFSMDTNTGLLKKNFAFNQIGVIGDFNGWGGDVVMEFNAAKRRFYADVENLSGGFKFRADADWALNWGVDGVQGGDNIAVETAGNYRVYFYLSNPNEVYYELNADMFGQEEPTGGNTGTTPEPEPPQPGIEADRWGLVGTITGWGESADLYMNEVGENLFVRKGVAVTADDQFKVRFNNDWAINYGGAGDVEPLVVNVGEQTTLVAGGKNLAAAAGTYDVYFNIATFDIWVMAEGEIPGGVTLNSVKLYADVSAPGWTNCNLWAWDDAGNNYTGGTWPGQALEVENVDGVDYYVWEAPAELTGKTISVIFNNGAAQTADITGVVLDKDHFFNINADLSYVMDAAKTVKLYADVSAPGWTNCNLWAWDDAGNNYTGGAWPGQALEVENVGGVDYYVWEAPESIVGQTISVIFNNGAAQTADITGVVLDKDHFFTINADLSYVMDGNVPTPEPEPTEKEYGLIGDMTGWGSDIKFEAMGDGGYKLLNQPISASEGFKVRLYGKWIDTDNYGAPDGSPAIVINEAYTLMNGGGSGNMFVPADGTYDLYFYPADLELYVMEVGKTPSK